jgi:hypothetical protein
VASLRLLVHRALKSTWRHESRAAAARASRARRAPLRCARLTRRRRETPHDAHARTRLQQQQRQRRQQQRRSSRLPDRCKSSSSGRRACRCWRWPPPPLRLWR